LENKKTDLKGPTARAKEDDAALGIKKRFERIDEMQDRDPNNIADLEIPMSLARR
jgi:hypothetical protein